MASRVEADVPPLQPELFLRGPGAVAGPLEAIPVHLEDRLPQIGFLGVGERFIPRQDPLPEVVHVRGGSVVKPAAIAKPILVDLKVDPRVILGVHPAAPLENQPQMVPVQGGILGVACVPPDPGNGFVHLGFGDELGIQLQHGGGQVHHQLAHGLDHQGLVFFFVFGKPGPAVVQAVFKEEFQCLLGKKTVQWAHFLSSGKKRTPPAFPPGSVPGMSAQFRSNSLALTPSRLLKPSIILSMVSRSPQACSMITPSSEQYSSLVS